MQLRRWHTDDAIIATWKARDSWLIRTALWQALTPKGTVIFLNGRGDFVEKYAETCRQWCVDGYHVLTWDWRGQGLSGRMFGESGRTHLDTFDPLLRDAQDLLIDPMVRQLPKPWILCGHSLGGHLALRLLHDRPGLFQKALLFAPMLGINAGPIPPKLARRFVRLMVATGFKKRFALGQTPYGAITRSTFRQQRLTSDTVRFHEEGEAIKANPALAVGGVTFGWVAAAFQSLDIVTAPGFLEAITTPVLVLLAGREQVVDSLAAEAAARRLTNGRIEWIDGAAHELLRETDSIRNRVLKISAEFMEAA